MVKQNIVSGGRHHVDVGCTANVLEILCISIFKMKSLTNGPLQIPILLVPMSVGTALWHTSQWEV
jgi:hypothetical protein